MAWERRYRYDDADFHAHALSAFICTAATPPISTMPVAAGTAALLSLAACWQ